MLRNEGHGSRRWRKERRNPVDLGLELWGY